MFSLGLLSARVTLFFFLFLSFWPWEKDPNRIKKSSFEIPQDPALRQTVRVALFYEKPEIQIGVPGPYEVKGFPGNEPLARGAFLTQTPIRPDHSGIRVGPRIYPHSGLRIESQTREVQIGPKKYHDVIHVLKNPIGSLTVVNEIDLEDYLKGVVPSEMNPAWPAEALKAQAVVSRTYAIFMNIENREFAFSVSSDVASQVYGGKTVERASSSRAVTATRGEILTSRGKIFPAFFHSSCGGRTTRSDYQWKIESHPSLKGVACTFCRGSKYDFWKASFSAGEVQKLLAKKGFTASGLRAIRPAEFDASGRVRFFEVQHTQGTSKVPANEFRLALGPDRLRSTRLKVSQTGDQFLFEGRGWGHGVGLCQVGAKRLAELGYGYREILRYYYPESEIGNLEDFPLEEVAETAGEENFLKGWFHKVKSYLEDF